MKNSPRMPQEPAQKCGEIPATGLGVVEVKVDKLEFLPPDDVLIFRYLSLSLSCFCFFGLFMCNPFVSFAFGAQFSVVVVVIVYCWWQFAMQFFNTRETVLLLPLLLLRWPCDCGYSCCCCCFC